jgi:hypothetical protein
MAVCYSWYVSYYILRNVIIVKQKTTEKDKKWKYISYLSFPFALSGQCVPSPACIFSFFEEHGAGFWHARIEKSALSTERSTTSLAVPVAAKAYNQIGIRSCSEATARNDQISAGEWRQRRGLKKSDRTRPAVILPFACLSLAFSLERNTVALA